MPYERRYEVGSRGIWSVRGPSLLGPFDTSEALAFDHPSLYAGRLVRDRTGRWNLLGFRYDEDESFVGEIADPIPVRTAGARLTLPSTSAPITSPITPDPSAPPPLSAHGTRPASRPGWLGRAGGRPQAWSGG